MMAYSVCHFGNDLCASMWFVYLNYYLLYVVGLSPAMTSWALLSGQIADGLMTPTVGLLSDYCKCTWLGRRNTWYYAGTALVVPSFLCTFMTPNLAESWCRNLWYVTISAIFNIGWASVQISTMTIVNELTFNQEKRDVMINSRNGFTYAANIFILALAFILFSQVEDNVTQFRILSETAIGAGLFASVIYLAFINENKLTAIALEREKAFNKLVQQHEEEDSDAEELESVEGKNWDDWLRTSEFYVFGTVYMCARIAMNVAAVFIPLYVATVTARPTAEGEESAETNFQVATVPLVAYTSSLLWSLLG